MPMSFLKDNFFYSYASLGSGLSKGYMILCKSFSSVQNLLIHMVSVVVICMVITNWVAVGFFCHISTQLCLIVNIYL